MLIGGTKGSDLWEDIICKSYEMDTFHNWTVDDVIDPATITTEAWMQIYYGIVTEENLTIFEETRLDFEFQCKKRFELSLFGTHDGAVNNCPCDTTTDHIFFKELHPELERFEVGMSYMLKLKIYLEVRLTHHIYLNRIIAFKLESQT